MIFARFLRRRPGRDPRSFGFSPRGFKKSKRIGTDRAGLKVCERCHRRYAPRSNRQRWCRACRPEVDIRRGGSGGVWLGFVPEERSCACCGRSFMARAAHQRFCCEWCRSRTPRPAEAEAARRLKYGTRVHARLRKAWAPRVATGTVRCARGAECVFAVGGVAGFILPGQAWDLGHVDGDPSRYQGPEHRRCNRRTAAHRVAHREESRW